MTSYNLFLDDVRVPGEVGNYIYPTELKSLYRLGEWEIVRRYESFVSIIQERGLPELVSFDHDLADIHYDPMTCRESFTYHDKTGFDCALWMVEYCRSKNLDLPNFLVHSLNPDGKERILNLLNNYKKKEMNTLTINLFGGPGTGKSTLCAKIFVALKMQGFEVEMAPEYVKDLVWEESFKKIENQLYIFGKQHNRIYRLLRKVKVIITDSPLLNSIIYYKGENPHFSQMVLWEHNAMNTLNFYIPRTFEYVENGRTQDLKGAKEVDEKYRDFLDENGVSYYIFSPNENSIDEIVDLVRSNIEPGKVPGDI